MTGKDPAGKPSPVRDYFRNIGRAVSSIFEGLAVTMSWTFRRPATIQYPDKIDKPVQEMLPDGYRGVLEVDLLRCSGCALCQKACPIDCIEIDVAKNPTTGVREIARFDINIGRCMFCGICSEACKFDSIRHTTEFETSVDHPDAMILHFVGDRPVPVSRWKAGEGPARRPQGSILRDVLRPHGRRDKRTGGPLVPFAPATAAAGEAAGAADDATPAKPAAELTPEEKRARALAKKAAREAEAAGGAAPVAVTEPAAAPEADAPKQTLTVEERRAIALAKKAAREAAAAAGGAEAAPAAPVAEAAPEAPKQTLTVEERRAIALAKKAAREAAAKAGGDDAGKPEA